jgi:hypothetical protein
MVVCILYKPNRHGGTQMQTYHLHFHKRKRLSNSLTIALYNYWSTTKTKQGPKQKQRWYKMKCYLCSFGFLIFDFIDNRGGHVFQMLRDITYKFDIRFEFDNLLFFSCLFFLFANFSFIHLNWFLDRSLLGSWFL